MFYTATLNHVFMPGVATRSVAEVKPCAIAEIHCTPSGLNAKWVLENGHLRMQWSRDEADKG